MKKTISTLIIISIMILTITGCKTSKSYTFDVETNEQIKVKLDTTNGERLSQENGRFTIENDEEEAISIGMFYLEEAFNELYDTVETLDGVEVIEIGEKEKLEFIFYKAKTETTIEYNYLVKLDNAKSGVVISNITSEEAARGVFELLTFELNSN